MWYEIAVLRRANPRPGLDGADRAVLATLIRLLPARPRMHRLVTVGTVLRCHRRLVAGKVDLSVPDGTAAATMLAIDFFHVDCTATLRRPYCLIVMEVGSRYVHIPRITANPDGPWTVQRIRNLLMDLGDRAAEFRFPGPRPGRAARTLIWNGSCSRPDRDHRPDECRPDHSAAAPSLDRIRRWPILGGLINEYERAA